MTGLFEGLPGAVVTDGVLQHAGNPPVEQRMLADGEAVAITGDRAVIAVSGEDRLSWLDSITSQAVTALAPGESTELLVLDPHGHVEHVAGVVDDGETAWLLVDAGDAEALLGWLLRMRFRLRVAPRLADEYVVAGAASAASITAAAPADVPLVWHDPWPEVGPGGAGYAAPEGHPGLDRHWVEVLVTPDEAARLLRERPVAGALAVDALRIAAWRPRWAAEVDDRLIPHEVDWLRTAVHLDKGCYRGQETVAKVHNLGHPPRRLVALHLDGSEDVLPTRGDAVAIGDTEVGAVTSVARHFEEGPIALALVRRGADTSGPLTVLTADGPVAAAAAEIVPAAAGATASVPRL
ncbi:MAG: glycine cleavage T C-terminal barrel domain-containing protein, partial [Microbacterium sp.]|uniref:CAF17-like 4Fe-4S cluster assembly/insertion protein YgfZ n=1 Tax=Microbacterium sp. TaxID=51671 RepID=UPI0039E2497B